MKDGMRFYQCCESACIAAAHRSAREDANTLSEYVTNFRDASEAILKAIRG